MEFDAEVLRQVTTRFEVLAPHLNERQRRLALAVEARILGHGGVRAVARAAGVSETTVRAGVFDLERGDDPLPAGRVRRPGGGRKSLTEHDPRLLPALLALVEPDERGDPMSPLRWTTKSLRHLAGELRRQGHPVSAVTVGRLLRRNGFSLQAGLRYRPEVERARPPFHRWSLMKQSAGRRPSRTSFVSWVVANDLDSETYT